MKQLLTNLINDLTTYNQPDMLNGYLNQLAIIYNPQLKKLGLPTIEEVESND